MKLPPIANELIDPTNKVVYEVMAYRTLTNEERLAIVLEHLRTNTPPAPGKKRTLITTLGLED